MISQANSGMHACTRVSFSFILSIFTMASFAMNMPTLQNRQQDANPVQDTLTNDSTQIKKQRKFVEELTYQTQQGLPVAASKIYFTDSKFTVSGFGETSYISYLGNKDRTSGDIELYNTNLYRFVNYLAYKPKPWLVLYGEVFFELFQDGFEEYEAEYFIEAFADFLIHDKFNLRVGTHQVHMGFVNNNDEPVMYYSVNRPDVERIIIPSQWIDLGVTMYGKINDRFSYSFGAFQGLDANRLNGGTWIRGGRADGLRMNFNSVIWNGKIGYYGSPNTEVVLNAIATQAGDNATVNLNGENVSVQANTALTSLFVRNEWKNWTFMALGSYGTMSKTDRLYALTQVTNPTHTGTGHVLGSQVYGAYFEVGYNLLPLFRKSGGSQSKGNLLYKPSEFKLPLFARIERLNTHMGVHPELENFDRFQTDLTCLTLGVNFNTRKNIVLKANYQFRNNKVRLANGLIEGDRFEVGMGFIF